MADDTQRKKKTTGTAPIRMNNEELQFPVTYDLKAVMTASPGDMENRKHLTNVFDELKIDYTYLNRSQSSKGSYTSFTYSVTLKDRETMSHLYELLKEIENLKFAL